VKELIGGRDIVRAAKTILALAFARACSDLELFVFEGRLHLF
jgi:hypothetical protein